MSAEPLNRNSNTVQSALVKKVIFFTGITLLILSGVIEIFHTETAQLLAINLETTSILAKAIMLVGIIDIIISMTLFRNQERK